MPLDYGSLAQIQILIELTVGISFTCQRIVATGCISQVDIGLAKYRQIYKLSNHYKMKHVNQAT